MQLDVVHYGSQRHLYAIEDLSNFAIELKERAAPGHVPEFQCDDRALKQLLVECSR
jgi:hypothetical protein